ncbi:MAG TPA: endolytic transglycosylase MltG [Candidatus Saccharimonadales bacterium]
MKYKADTLLRRPVLRRLVLLGVIVLVLIVAGIFWARHTYYEGLKPVSRSAATQLVDIKPGTSSADIGKLLASKRLIRSAWAFELYVHSAELNNGLQAGTYALSPNEGTVAIIKTLTRGNVSTNLVTILPGRRIDQVRADLINDGFSPASVDRALDPSRYSDMPVMAYKPAGASLEGLLYPDSFQRTADTDPSVIVRESLQEMGEHLTVQMQQAFAQENLTPYQGLILASIVEQEVSKPSDRTQVAQVFLSRLKQGATLGSDVTAYYGAILAGKAPSVNYDSPYNTLIHTGLPPTPISTVSDSSLQAVAHPASTNWLYFVTGDNGTTYFSTTLQQHNQQVQEYCHQLCAQ